jgi:hypothetical protein
LSEQQCPASEELIMVMVLRRRVGRVVGLGGLVLLIAAPSAWATARFASPSGTGTACTQGTPCEIETAVEKAATGDDITIEPGTYGSPTPLPKTLDDEGKTLSIHGQAGQPRPVIISKAGFGIELLGMNSSVSDLDIEDPTGQYGIYVSGTENASIERVIAHVSAAKAVACYPSGTLTDSVCWSSGSEGLATTVLVLTYAAATYRNDTLIASGSGGTAVLAEAGVGSTRLMSLVNTIARGTGADILARTDTNPKSKAIVNAEHSNYATVQIENGGGGSTTSVTPAGTAGNQMGAPAFVNSAAGDFHELSSSITTIDLGVNSPLNGTTDLDGNPRQLGASTDIGAYELIPPLVVPVLIPAGAAPVPAPAPTPPTVANAAQSNSTWSEGNKLASFSRRKKRPVGTTFSFTLNEPASVTFAFTQLLSGRKIKGKCVAQTKKNRQKPPCKLMVTRGTLSFTGHNGMNKVVFQGRISRSKKLALGHYTLLITATNTAGQHAIAHSLNFTIANR